MIIKNFNKVFPSHSIYGYRLSNIAIYLLTITSALLIISCNNDDETSPFGNILSQALFAGITDSIHHQPNNDELYFRRAVLLNKNNYTEPALADFRKAWSISKQEKYAFGITNSWLDKNPDSAVLFLNEALKELPQSYLLKLTLARAYDGLDRTDDALKICDEILSAMPDQPDVLVLKSELLEKKGDQKGSIASLEKAYMLTSANAKLAFRLAYKYAEAKDPRAILLCDALIKRDTLQLHAEPYYIKGIFYSNTSDNSKALHFFDETIKRDYNNLNAYIEKGKILLNQKKTNDAFKVFQLANTINPAFPDAYYWIGVCQEKWGQKEDAKLSYEKAFSLDKTFTEAKEAAEKLGK